MMGLFSLVDPWVSFEKRVLEVVTIALEMLHVSKDLPSKEDDLNRRLFQVIVRDALHEWELRTGQTMEIPPFYEARNQPDPNDQKKQTREEKRPELQWAFRDTKMTMGVSFLYYTVECKRLGKAPSSSWVLNRNYVLNGILRFVNEEWDYGHLCRSGLMVGYVQSMEPDDVLHEVNECASENKLPTVIRQDSDWFNMGVSRLGHTLERDSLEPRRFELLHLWVDVRKDTK